MNRRLTLIMTFAVVGGFAVILLMNVASLIGFIPEKFISPNDVRGIAVEHNKLLYTLNFSQQNTVVDICNRFIPVSKQDVDTRKIASKNLPEITKIIIYRFNAPDIEITPTAYIEKTQSVSMQPNSVHTSLVFSVPLWNSNGYLEEAASDEMEKLLSTTYDP